MIARWSGALAVGFFLAGANAALAQAAGNCEPSENNWSLCVGADPKECWGVSAPMQTVNSKDGAVVAVRRGDILLFTTFRAGGGTGEVSFTGGYPFAPESTVTMTVGAEKFDLFVDGEWAWSGSPEEDARIITALKGGVDVVLTARSARGTQTADTFSLRGFTAAVEAAAARCAS